MKSEPAPAKAVASPADTPAILGGLLSEFRGLAAILSHKASLLNHKTEPTTFQSTRYLNGECEKVIKELDLLGDILVAGTYPSLPQDFNAETIVEKLLTAETRVYGLKDAHKLDDLPPGNPGEQEFERLLKDKITTNRVFTGLLNLIATTVAALTSDTYKLGLAEPERAAAWRLARKTKLEAIMVDIDQKLDEGRKYVESLETARAGLVSRLADNDQMTFESEINAAEAPQVGDDGDKPPVK